MKKIYLIITFFILTIGNKSVKGQVTTTLNPVQDAYFLSFGGGQGANPILKFDISSIPAGSTVIKVTLNVYIYDTTNATSGGAVTGNMIFRNLNNKQGWVETDSAFKFAPNMEIYSDSVTQLTGFGDSIGWASSSDIKGIFLKDFLLANTYCTVSLKDPDDMTCCGAVGPNFSAFLGDQVDSIVVGNKTVGSDEMIFYPREYSNVSLRPKLIVEYNCSSSYNQTLTICSYDSVVVGTNVYNSTGIYNDTLIAVNGCDSVIITDLTVNPALNLSVTVSNDSLISDETGATY